MDRCRNRSSSFQDHSKESNIMKALSKTGTNVIFNFNNMYSVTNSFFNCFQRQRIISIHGMKYLDQNEAQKCIRNLIWFTYREIPGLSQASNSDTGWGCLIRVGQMALAAALQAHFRYKFHAAPKNIDIIPFFLQEGGKQQKYSLKKIVETGKMVYENIQYKKWFRVPEICKTLQILHNQNEAEFAETLRIVSFDQILYFEQVIKALGEQPCKCEKKRIICSKCHKLKTKEEETKNIQSLKSTIEPGEQDQSFQDTVEEKKNFNQVLIFIYCFLGIKVKQKQFTFIKQLLNLEFSLGILGGVPQKAYYLIGYDNKDIIYMDPHYVQEKVTRTNLSTMLQTFVNKTYMKVEFNKLDPSMAFAFLIDSLDNIQTLQKKLDELKGQGLQYFGVKLNQPSTIHEQQRERFNQMQ